MKLMIARCRLFLTLILMLCLGEPLCNGQQPQTLTTDRVLTLDRQIELHLSKATLLLVLGTLSVQQDVPIGLELSAVEKNEPKLDIDVEKTPLIQVLNLIVQQEPAYMWELRDGVINFTPVHDRESFFEKLLDTKISRFESPKGNNKFAIKDAILKLPEVTDLMEANRVIADRISYPHNPSIHANQADLSDKNTDMRSLLNKIIRESEHNSWVLQWVNKKQRVFELGF